MTKNIRAIGLGVLAAMCALALAQDAITLKLAPKVGDTFKYKLSAKVDLMGNEASLSAHLADKVTEVASNGDYTVESSQSDAKAEIGGQTLPIPDETTTSKFSAMGNLLDLKAQQVSAESWRLGNLTAFVYPANAVKVGEEWTSTIAADAKTGAVAAKSTYKVEALEKIGSRDTAKVKVSYSETEGDTPAKNDGYVWIDTKDGSVVKAESKWSNVPLSPGMPPANGTVTMERED